MSPTQSLINSLCLAASSAMALQCLFLGLALVCRPALRSQANLALAVASFAFALAMVRDVISRWGWDVDLPRSFWVGSKLPILFIPPFAYLHIVGLVSGSSWRFRLQDAWHMVFCLAFCLAFVTGVLQGSSVIVNDLDYGILLVTVVQGGSYLFAGFRFTGGGGSPQIAWLRLLLWGLAGFLVMHAAINAVGYIIGNLPWAQLSAHLVALLILYAIAWGSLGHSKALQRPPDEVLRDLVAPLGKYRKSRQSADDARRILIKLDHAVLTEALYREAGLTLPMLAARVGAKSNVVSQALNETLGLSFFDYLNDHRIDEAKRMLLSTQETDATILDIAFAVGFNSKSTFNAAFKKRTGQTPSMFRKQASTGTSL